MLTPKTHDRVLKEAQRWVHTGYYDRVEGLVAKQWKELLDPFLADHGIDFSTTLELAIGHGRMTGGLLERGAKKLIGVDVLEENIDFCRKRFANEPRVVLYKNDGATLPVPENSVTFVFCFDSMVHFDSDIVRAYLGEFRRVLVPGGFAFCHHSNRHRHPGADWQKAPHARNFMSAPFFAHYALKEGLENVAQKVIDWGSGPKFFEKLDCLSLVQKPYRSGSASR